MLKCNQKVNNPVEFYGLEIVDRFGDYDIIDARTLLNNSAFNINVKQNSLFIKEKQLIEINFKDFRYYVYVENLIQNLDKLSNTQKIDFVLSTRFVEFENIASKENCVLFLECAYNTVKDYIDTYIINETEPDFQEGEKLDYVIHNDEGGYVQYATENCVIDHIKYKKSIIAKDNELFEEIIGQFLPYEQDVKDIALRFGVNLIKDYAKRVWVSYK